MTQEERNLLLRDLSARFPYGVKIDREWIAPMTGSPEHTIDELGTFDIEILNSWVDEEGAGLAMCDDGNPRWVRKYSCKPYLRPMSSMTEEERQEICSLVDFTYTIFIDATQADRYIDWLNSHHFDYRGLIEKGLALEAPKYMYNS